MTPPARSRGAGYGTRPQVLARLLVSHFHGYSGTQRLIGMLLPRSRRRCEQMLQWPIARRKQETAGLRFLLVLHLVYLRENGGARSA